MSRVLLLAITHRDIPHRRNHPMQRLILAHAMACQRLASRGSMLSFEWQACMFNKGRTESGADVLRPPERHSQQAQDRAFVVAAFSRCG